MFFSIYHVVDIGGVTWVTNNSTNFEIFEMARIGLFEILRMMIHKKHEVKNQKCTNSAA